MDLTAPTINTFGGLAGGHEQPGADMVLQFGQYRGAKNDGVQRMYVDYSMVTDYLITP